YLSVIQPASGITADNARVYPVIVHWIAFSEVPKYCCKFGIATLITVLSRITMIIPRITASRGAINDLIENSAGLCMASLDMGLFSLHSLCNDFPKYMLG